MSKKFAVIGNPIIQSKSPEIHKLFAAQFNIALSYERILASVEDFPAALCRFQQSGGWGVNVTSPFKLEAMRLVRQCTARAQQAGSVNTITFKEEIWSGDNTDGIGLLRDLTKNQRLDLQNKKILLLGAGGAARGILPALLSAQPAQIMIANRTLASAEELLTWMQDSRCTASDLMHLPQQHFDLIINATSAGLQNAFVHLPAHLIKDAACYDLSYGAGARLFLQWAKQNSARVCYDGLGMLVEQAAETFYSWHGVMPITHSVIKLLREAL